MKKLIGLFVAGVAVLALNGCGGGGDDYYPPDPDLTTLFLVDEFGDSYGGIPYICDSMRDWEVTLPNGEFTFLPPDDCVFDFDGLDGVYGDIYDDIVRIVDYTDDGKGGIDYDCASFGAGTTYGDGSFDYDIDDECVFYL